MNTAAGFVFIIYMYCLFSVQGYPLPLRLRVNLNADKVAEEFNLSMFEGNIDVINNIQESYQLENPSTISLYVKERLLTLFDIIQSYEKRKESQYATKKAKKDTDSNDVYVSAIDNIRQNNMRGSRGQCAVCARCEDRNHRALSIACYEECRTGRHGTAIPLCLTLVQD